MDLGHWVIALDAHDIGEARAEIAGMLALADEAADRIQHLAWRLQSCPDQRLPELFKAALRNTGEATDELFLVRARLEA